MTSPSYLPKWREMTVVAALPDADRAAVSRVEGEIRATLAGEKAPSDVLVTAVAQFQLSLDRLRLLKLQNAAEMVLAVKLPEIDLQSLQMQSDGAAPQAVMSALLHLQAELEQLFAVIGRAAEDSIHPQVKEWSGVIRAALRAVYDSTEAMRWELLEAEADADIAAGRVMKFASTKNAAAFLRRIGK